MIVVDMIKRVYSFKSPFDTFNRKEEVLLVSKKDIRELISSDLDVFSLIYNPVGLSQNDMLQDMNDNVKILTFRTNSGDYIDIPEKYVIIDSSTFNGVEYQSKLFVFKLPALPTNEDLDILKTELEEYINGRLGIECASKIMETSAKTVITRDQHDLNMIDRNQKKKDVGLYTKYINCLTENSRFKTFIDKLLQYNKNNCN